MQKEHLHALEILKKQRVELELKVGGRWVEGELSRLGEWKLSEEGSLNNCLGDRR